MKPQAKSDLGLSGFGTSEHQAWVGSGNMGCGDGDGKEVLTSCSPARERDDACDLTTLTLGVIS
jgi:hypothetical protein